MKPSKLFCVFLVCGVLASLPSWASLCERIAFGEESDFVSVAVSRKLLEKGQWYVYERENLNQHTRHWLREEAESFFNFFLRRVDQKTLMERLKDSEDFSLIHFKDFMEKKRFYDSLSPKIVPIALKRSFAGFRQVDSLEDIKSLSLFLKTHIGKKALVYLLTNLPLEHFFQTPTAQQTLSFILDYTHRHKADIKPLKERIQKGRLFKNIQIKEIKKLFLSLGFLTREHDTISFSEWEQKVQLFLLSLQELFESILKIHIQELKQTVQILELYVPPHEISKMMTHPLIFLTRASQLKETISIMEKNYDFYARLSPASLKTVRQNPPHYLTPLKIQDLFEPPERDNPTFIRWLIRTYPENMFSETEPLRLKHVSAILEQKMGKGLLALNFQHFDKAWTQHFIEGFFAVEWESLQKISHTLSEVILGRTLIKGITFQTKTFFRRSRPTPAGMLIWAYLDKMTYIEDLTAFSKILHILHKYITFEGQEKSIKNFSSSGQRIFTVQVMDIINVSDRLSFSNVLQDINYLEKAFRRQLPHLLREKSILDIIPSFHKEEIEREHIYEDIGLRRDPPKSSLFANTFGGGL